MSNDHLVKELLRDTMLYRVTSDGILETRKTRQGKIGTEWRVAGYDNHHKGKTYRFVKFKGKHLKIHRIVYQHFKGDLQSHLVINHLDGNGLNNHPDNLQQTTVEYNAVYRTQEAA
jgi:hypothetical protein